MPQEGAAQEAVELASEARRLPADAGPARQIAEAKGAVANLAQLTAG